MEGRPEARPRGGARQCAYCHGPLLPREERWCCEGCGVAVHADCAAALDRCPALGCPGLPPGALPEGRVSWARLVVEATPWLEVGDALHARDAWGEPAGEPLPSSEVWSDLGQLESGGSQPSGRGEPPGDGPRAVPWSELVADEGPWPESDSPGEPPA